MAEKLTGLDQLAKRGRRPVTPPRKPSPTRTPAPAPAPVVESKPTPPPPKAPAKAPRTPQKKVAPALARGGAIEQLGVRVHRHQIRNLRRVVHLLDDEHDLHRPTQAEIIQVLLEGLPSGPDKALEHLAQQVRDYRARIED